MDWKEKFLDKVVCGDCLELMKELPDGCVDLVVTDPPYGSGGRNGSTHLEEPDVGRNRMSIEAFEWFFRQCADALSRITTTDIHSYVFSDWRRFSQHRIIWESVGWELRSLIVWSKGNGMGEFWRSTHEFILWFTKVHPRQLQHGSCYNVLTIPPIRTSKKHPVQKPVELILELINASGGDVILDPFLGSGTTAVAAKQLGRHFIGMEINPKYCEIAERRLSQEVLSL